MNLELLVVFIYFFMIYTIVFLADFIRSVMTYRNLKKMQKEQLKHYERLEVIFKEMLVDRNQINSIKRHIKAFLNALEEQKTDE